MFALKSECVGSPAPNVTIHVRVTSEPGERPQLHPENLRHALEDLPDCHASITESDDTLREVCLTIQVPCALKDMVLRLVRSHIHVANLAQQIDQNPETARYLIAAAADEPMGRPMLERLRQESVDTLDAYQRVLDDGRVLNRGELPHQYRRELLSTMDRMLDRIALIDELLKPCKPRAASETKHGDSNGT